MLTVVDNVLKTLESCSSEGFPSGLGAAAGLETGDTP